MRAQLSVVLAAALVAAMGCSQPASDTQAGPSDAAVAANVQQKLAGLAGQKLDVTAQNGVVRLSGTADTAAVKAEAVTLARGADGVKDIVDFITVGPPAAAEPAGAPASSYVPPPPSDPVGYAPDIGESAGSGLTADAYTPPADDASITENVKAALRAVPQLRGSTIDVVTRDGVVTLSGAVDSDEAKGRAEDVASIVPGGKRVDNQLTVRR